MVKNKNEWQESRKRLKERKEHKAKEGRTGDEPAEFGFPMGGSEEQIKRRTGGSRPPTLRDAREFYCTSRAI